MYSHNYRDMQASHNIICLVLIHAYDTPNNCICLAGSSLQSCPVCIMIRQEFQYGVVLVVSYPGHPVPCFSRATLNRNVRN